MKRSTPHDDPESAQDAGPLFALTHARIDSPATSKVAAVRAESMSAEHCRMILDTLAQMGGSATVDEIAAGMYPLYAHKALDRHQVGRRMSDLREQGRVVETGEVRATPKGRPAQVWAVT